MEHSCSFVVDLKCVSDSNDLQADDNGVWKHWSHKTYIVLNDVKKIVYQSSEQFSKQSKDSDCYVFV